MNEPAEIEKNQEELKRKLNALRQGKLEGREVYRAVQDFGENNFQAARSEVEALLESDVPDLRFVALKVLTRYWRLMEHWETACAVLLHDPEVECRFRAASDLGSLMMNTQDTRTLKVLAQVVCNEQEEDVVREEAYAAMKAILQYDPHEQFHIASRSFDLAKEADWEMVKRYNEMSKNR
jgi:hypothetical protein